MASVSLEEQIEVPLGIDSLAAFRRWVFGDTFPDGGRIDFIDGRIEVDMSPEDLHCHGKVKTEIAIVVGSRIRDGHRGELYIDSARVTSPAAELSVEPDLVFVSNASLNDDRVTLVPKASGKADRYIELEGGPDLIVEVVSDSSVKKDTERLPKAYFDAGVKEYWIVDAREADVIFRIHHRGKTSFEETAPDDNGFSQSEVMNCGYRLVRSRDADGRLQFTLEEQE
jgi:Uma2 family endonuclease